MAKLEFAIAAARSMAAAGNEQNARELLARPLKTAHDFGLLRVELEMRLALGELESKSGKKEAYAQLVALEKAARAKGFTVIANKAVADRTAPQ